MKLGTAAVLCAAFFASVCQAIPLEFSDWSEWEFEGRDQGTETEFEALIQQDVMCNDYNQVFNETLANYDVTRNQNTNQVTGILYQCQTGNILFLNKAGNGFERATSPFVFYSCSANSWKKSIEDNGVPRCYPSCEELSATITNGNGRISYDPSQSPYTFNTTAKYDYTCKEGYVKESEGSTIRICDENGNWQGKAPTCIKKCPVPSTVFNMTNAERSEPQAIMNPSYGGEDFDYRCRSGYVLFVSINGGDYERALSDSITYQCRRSFTDSGRYTYNQSIAKKGRPECLPLCPVLPNIANGKVSYGNRPREPDDIATYTCDARYELVEGSETRTCSRDGQWSGQQPRCQKLCPNPNTVFNFTNADPSAVRPIQNSKGEEFDYKCQSGYVLFVSKNEVDYLRASSDSITYQCIFGSGSTYDPSIADKGRPKCYPECTPLPTIINGSISYSPPNIPYTEGTEATYSCNTDEGYELRGSRTRICRNGQWTGRVTTCVFTGCNLPPTITNGVVSTDKPPVGPGPGGQLHQLEGTIAVYSCKPNFQLKGASSLRCINNKWDRPPPSCSPQGCHVPPEINNGNRSLNRNPFMANGHLHVPIGTTATYVCDRFSDLDGFPVRTCTRNGNWDRPQPSCVAKKCPAILLLNVPANVPEIGEQLISAGHKDIYEKIKYKPYFSRIIVPSDRTVGSKAYLTCINGWELMPGTGNQECGLGKCQGIQECIANPDGTQEWTKPSICVYKYKDYPLQSAP